MANIRLIIECDTVAQLADELVKQLTSLDAKYARVEFRSPEQTKALAEELTALGKCLPNANGDFPFKTGEAEKPVPAPAPVPASAPASAPAPAPVSVPAPAPTAVPTTPTAYTLDQLIEAVTPLARDNTKVPQLQSLINGKYGVVGLNELPAEAYGAFAADIRAMGARI